MDQKAHTEELISKYKDYIATIDALYKLKTRNEDEIDQLFKMIKTNLFDTNLSTPKMIIQQIAGITSCCCHYFKSYWTLFKKIYEEYHPTPSITLSPVFDYFVYKEYGIVFDERSKMMFEEFESNKYSLDVHEENTIYWAIMNDDVKSLTAFTDAKSFDKNQKFYSYMYPDPINGLSLLEVCCIHSSIECFKFLTTKFEAQVTSKCLQYAFISGSQEILNECLKSQKPNAECMLFAIYSHNMDFVNLLIKEYGIQIDLESCGTMLNLQALLAYYEQTNDIFKCFVYSAYFNIPSLCEYFLSLGAKIDLKNNDHTALHAATSNNLKEIVEFLISKGANINEEDGTCLHTAAWFNSNDVAEVLISHGVDVNSKNSRQETGLHIAANYNCKEVIEVLISHGAEVNARDKYDHTPLDICVQSNNKIPAEVLISNGAEINASEKYQSPLDISAMNNSFDVAELLLSHGAKINQSQYGENALHISAANNSKEVAELLLSHGVDINAKYIAETAIHIAAKKNHPEMIEILLSHKANISSKDDCGRMPLHYAAENNCKEALECLISNGAKVNQKDNYGKTALDLAHEKGNKEIEEILMAPPEKKSKKKCEIA